MDEVRIVGHIPKEEVKIHLEHVDVVCIPSVSQQAVPTIAVEAMAAGNVVLCSQFHTVNEAAALIRLPMDHVPSWYQALKDVHDDPQDANDIVREGLDSSKDHDVEQVVTGAYLPMLTMLVDHYLA